VGIVVYVKFYGMGIKIFPWYGVDKKESQCCNFHYNTSSKWFLSIWKGFCGRNVKLKVGHIINSHYVMTLVRIWTIQWFIKIHVKLVGTCHKDYNLTKELKNISFKNKISMKFYTYKKNP